LPLFMFGRCVVVMLQEEKIDTPASAIAFFTGCTSVDASNVRLDRHNPSLIALGSASLQDSPKPQKN